MNVEYESVLCAALLHDIGKFWQRAGNDKTPHYEVSSLFVEKYRDRLPKPELVKALVGHHHESGLMNRSARPDALEDSRQRVLAFLISRADSLSSKERSTQEQTSGYRTRSALDTVFGQIDIGRGAGGYDPSEYKYPLSPLYQGSSFPEKLGRDYEHSVEDYDDYTKQFEAEFDELFAAPYEGMSDTLASVIQKYLWCVPSDTTRRPRDVSLADHLKTTCALAACFYKYHESEGWGEDKVKDDGLAKMLLVCGDVSGIQDYIYGIASVEHGGVAKRLRGRSFRVSLLTEAVALRLLKELGLPHACKIISAGGHFYLLVPNTEQSLETLERLNRLVSEWLLEEYAGELALSVQWAEISGSQLAQGKFDEALDEVKRKTSFAKLNKFRDVIEEGPMVFHTQFDGHGACPVCDRRPALSGAGERAPCRECELDEALGRALLKAEWLVFSRKQHGTAVSLFQDDTWYACLVKSENDAAELEPLTAYRMTPGRLISGVPSGFAMYAGYVPRWSPDEWRQAVEENEAVSKQDGEYGQGQVESGEAIKSFTAIASAAEGTSLLGVLRADVDHLGLIFTLGMKDKASISRLSSISSLLNVFFTSELVKLIKSEFPNTYIAYSGGDDLMLIGPWDSVINLSNRIAEEFARYTAYNPNITISAGIGTYRSRVPIATTSVQTGDILEQSKAGGRNSLTLFQTTVSWDRFDDLKNWAARMIESVKNDGITKSFLYRLLRYQEMARMFYNEEGGARTALFKPHLAYDIGRNFTDENGRPNIDPKLHGMLLDLLKPESSDTWPLLKAPITWATYTLRKEN